jgi:hypothetical protein
MMDLRTQPAVDPHRSLHSDTGGLAGEHPGRSRNPPAKVVGLAWLEFEKPDLARAERFLSDFRFAVADRTRRRWFFGDTGRVRPASCAAGQVPGSSGPRSPPTPGRIWTGWPARGPTARSDPPGARHRSSASDTSRPAPPGSGRRWTGTWTLRVGALIPNPMLCLADGKQVRLDDVLDGAPALLAGRRPEPELLDLCREHGITPVRITAQPDTSTDTAWVEARLARALADDPSLTVLVRPDRVIAAVANRCQPPRLPWTVP